MSDHATGGHGSLRSYLIGFALSVVLTLIPFWLVMGEPLSNPIHAVAIIFALGAVQMIVHLHYFLHVSLKVDSGWQVMALLFTVLLLAIVLAGSIWVMFHLHENMMPAHDQIERIRNLP